MPIATPFHPRTQALCSSYRWKDWSGYSSVCRYESVLDFEYSAFRNRAGLLDVSPLFKVRVRGRQCVALLDRFVPRDLGKCKVGQVLYTPWCDDDGKTLDDGTLQRLREREFRVTSAYSNFRWLEKLAEGLDVTLEDETEQTAALSLQGPFSRAVLAAAGVAPARDLGYFRVCRAQLGAVPIELSRTGYTGDLGFELWIPRERALEAWDALMAAGAPYGITPAGLDALDVTRIEAGLILIDVDYYSSRSTAIESRKSSPFEIGLGWCIPRQKGAWYVGKEALRHEIEHGPVRELVGLEISWPQIEALYEKAGLPPEIHEGGIREVVPAYHGDHRIGHVSSRCWSPLLKRPIALATLDAPYYATGSQVDIDVLVEYDRFRVPAKVVKRPFFDPPRKRS